MRQEFTKATKRAILWRTFGICEGDGCHTLLCVEDNYHFDHIIACELGGDNSLKNCQLLCVPCHKIKTRKDAAIIAKSKRLRARAAGKRKPRKITHWRKFNGAPVIVSRRR